MRKQSREMRMIVASVGRCELCGSVRCLEAHHIIPVSLGGDDSQENLLCVCEKCHSLLTPRSLLTKKGLQKVKSENAKQEIKIQLKIQLYENIDRKMDEGVAFTDAVFESIEEVLT